MPLTVTTGGVQHEHIVGTPAAVTVTLATPPPLAITVNPGGDTVAVELTADQVVRLTSFVGPPGPAGGGADWTFYATRWDVEPSFTASIVGGAVYTYVLDSVSRYRFVPSPYAASSDAFYSTFDGSAVSGQIAARG